MSIYTHINIISSFFPELCCSVYKYILKIHKCVKFFSFENILPNPFIIDNTLLLHIYPYNLIHLIYLKCFPNMVMCGFT